MLRTLAPRLALASHLAGGLAACTPTTSSTRPVAPLTSSPLSVTATPATAASTSSLQQAMAEHAVRKPTFWQFAAGRTLAERVFASPPELIDYLTKDNQLNGFPATPRRAALDPALMADVKSALAELPSSVQGKVAAKLKGVFLVSDLGSSAFTDYTKDEHGEPEGAFIALDADAINRPANAWFSWKESSPFRPDGDFHLRGILAAPADNTRKETIQFILLHEFGHVLAFKSNIHPFWGLDPKDVKDSQRYPFFNLSWTIVGNTYKHKATKATMPGALHYYKSAPTSPPAREMLAFYQWLEQSDFVSLYAATNPFDDFADAFATYVHSVMMKRPFSLTLYEGTRPLKTYEGCWEAPRCQAKRRLLEELVGSTVSHAYDLRR